MDVEDVAGVGLPARGPAQEQGYLAVGPGVAGEVVQDHQHVAAGLHEVFGDGHGRVGGGVLQAGRVLLGRGHHDGRVHGLGLAQVVHDLAHGLRPFAHGAVDADHFGVALVEDGVHAQGGLAGLAVAQDQLALAAAHGEQGVHHLDPGLQGRGHRGAVHDVRGGPLHGPPTVGLQVAAAVQGMAHGVEDPAQQAVAHRGVQDPAGAPGLHAGRDPVALADQHHAGHVGVQVEGHALGAVLELHDLLGPEFAESGHADHAFAHEGDGPHALDLQAPLLLAHRLVRASQDALQPLFQILDAPAHGCASGVSSPWFWPCCSSRASMADRAVSPRCFM